ncbi:glycosyltransferase family 4 protein [Natronincola ferrireducens]|uniref:Glycosyltransferase involved in cell wall bisynthesis n=1 Tax=Natronincola ferrireducens TaxID=393762 RepID=A0A1G8X5M5_9FIRM|nr:glycosyltransferase family 4 protein [Natronincola ferrireducens]SDJ85853.1 Glycosyltransferase involved in cell wall bisynthesis [Natronincola ferrireducens]
MKKIVHVFTVSMSVIFLEGLYEKLKSKGYELIVICSDGEEVRHQERLGNVKYYPVNMSRGINPIKDLSALIKIISILKKEKPLIVHGHTPKGGILAMMAAKLLKIKHRPYHLHGLKYPSEVGAKRLIIKWMEKMTISLSTKVFAVSNSLKEFAIASGLGSNLKIMVLLNGSVKGIDIKDSEEIRKNKEQTAIRLGIKKNEVTIGFVGRITEEKGIFELLKAYKRLIGSKQNIGLILCGPTEIKNSQNSVVFDEIRELPNVQYFGQVHNPLEYMVCCDIFVLPSWREGFGLVNIEANSVGLPVITTDIVGCKDSIEDQKTGILIESNNVCDLIDALELLIEDPALRKEMGQNGIQRVRDLYDRNKIWNTLLEEYERMIKAVKA